MKSWQQRARLYAFSVLINRTTTISTTTTTIPLLAVISGDYAVK